VGIAQTQIWRTVLAEIANDQTRAGLGGPWGQPEATSRALGGSPPQCWGCGGRLPSRAPRDSASFPDPDAGCGGAPHGDALLANADAAPDGDPAADRAQSDPTSHRRDRDTREESNANPYDAPDRHANDNARSVTRSDASAAPDKGLQPSRRLGALHRPQGGYADQAGAAFEDHHVGADERELSQYDCPVRRAAALSPERALPHPHAYANPLRPSHRLGELSRSSGRHALLALSALQRFLGHLAPGKLPGVERHLSRAAALGSASHPAAVAIGDTDGVSVANPDADERRPHANSHCRGDGHAQPLSDAYGNADHNGALPDIDDGSQRNAQRHLDGYPYPSAHPNAGALSNSDAVSHPD